MNRNDSVLKCSLNTIVLTAERLYFKENICRVSIGACHCQIMDWVIPGSVDMSKVKFDAQCEDDYRHNFSLLRHAFRKNSITKVSALCLVSDVTSYSVFSIHVT